MAKPRKRRAEPRPFRFRPGAPTLIMASNPVLLLLGIREWDEDAGAAAADFTLTGYFGVFEDGEQVAFGAWLIPNGHSDGGTDGDS